MIIKQKPSQDYIKTATAKDMIVVHYTAGGSLAGAEATLAIRDYVNVHYCIDLDGKVYQYFDEKYWAYHTGTNQADAKRSIGIEIVNWGHLSRKGNTLYTWTGKKLDWSDVVRCTKFRGFEYWQKLTDKQVESLRELIAEIKSRHGIRRVTTHAKIKTTKLDYPPDYPQLIGIID